MFFIILGLVWVVGSVCFCLALGGMAASPREASLGNEVLTRSSNTHTPVPDGSWARDLPQASA